jgi:hypothetical protein
LILIVKTCRRQSKTKKDDISQDLVGLTVDLTEHAECTGIIEKIGVAEPRLRTRKEADLNDPRSVGHNNPAPIILEYLIAT